MKQIKTLNSYLRWTFFSGLSGAFSGLAATIFLISLEWVTGTRNTYPVIIWLLPIAGLGIGWVYYKFGQDVESGNSLIIDEIHTPKKIIPFHMTPFILLGTLMTHLFGGSAGREGTSVQMGASLSDQLSHFFKIEAEERKVLLVSGAGAGFAAAIGAPWAGVLFGIEMIYIGRFKFFALYQCLIASFVGYGITILLGAPHTHYPIPEIPDLSLQVVFWVAVAGLAFGIAARFFTVTTHIIEKLSQSWISYPPLKPFVGGLLLVGFFYWEGSYQYVGLGIPHIQSSLEQVTPFKDPVLKSLFTSLTVGTGFKGGEFIPLVFVGTTLGSALSVMIPLGFSFLAALGFAAVFGAATNTPIACTIMAMEVFGYQIGPFALVACLVSKFISGPQSVYKTQRTYKKL